MRQLTFFHTRREKVLFKYCLVLVYTVAFVLCVTALAFAVNVRDEAAHRLQQEEFNTELKLRESVISQILKEKNDLSIEMQKELNKMYEKLDQFEERFNSIKEANPFLLSSNETFDFKGDFVATAYDLSVQSCGKPIGHPAYGITRSGFDLSHHTWDSAMTIAVDPTVIPLGTKVAIHFEDEEYQKYNGIYTARDTGSAIKGRKIDFFMGDFQQYEPHPKALEFGVRSVRIAIVKET